MISCSCSMSGDLADSTTDPYIISLELSKCHWYCVNRDACSSNSNSSPSGRMLSASSQASRAPSSSPACKQARAKSAHISKSSGFTCLREAVATSTAWRFSVSGLLELLSTSIMAIAFEINS